MKPALSVIFFTVASGAGLGLFALLVVSDLFGWTGALAPAQFIAAGGVALALTAAGLVSSTFHLANPKNAWRAFARFRSSWLSREGVFAAAFFPAALAYLALIQEGATTALRLGAAAAVLLLAWATIYSTGMIYACLKTIRQWHNPLVPGGYVLLAHYTGVLLLVAMLRVLGLPAPALEVLALALLLAAAALKALYYAWTGASGTGPNIGTATGLTRGTVRAFDVGHSHGTFLTREFGFALARSHARALRLAVFVAGFALPLALLAGSPGAPAAVLACLSALAGVLAERWLFFAEAQHVVRLYHGQQRC